VAHRRESVFYVDLELRSFVIVLGVASVNTSEVVGMEFEVDGTYLLVKAEVFGDTFGRHVSEGVLAAGSSVAFVGGRANVGCVGTSIDHRVSDGTGDASA
jgi:hypothetical protein